MRYFILFIFFYSSLFSINIKLIKDKNISVSPNETQWIISYFRNKRVNIDNKEAKRIVKENRMLSNEYIKNYALPKKLKLDIVLSLEEKLASLYIKRMQKKININNKVLKSYYETKKEKFVKKGKVSTVIFISKSFDKALKIYNIKKSSNEYSIEDLIKYAKNNNIKIFKKISPFNQFHPVIQKMILNHKAGYITPPFLFLNNYITIYIKDYQKDTPMSFEEAKKSIRKILLMKIFSNTKNRLIKNIKEKYR